MIVYSLLDGCIILVEELLQVVLAPQLHAWARDTDYLDNDQEEE